jgi:orotidine-5'-phosphate decarboxylase
MNFLDKLLAVSRQQDSLLCVGLDPEQERLPSRLHSLPAARAVTYFCQAIIEATAPYVCAFKPNLAFFEVLGPEGMYVFQKVLQAIPEHIPIIVDAKRGDLENTARNYAATVFDIYACDAVTVNPYLGYDSVAPFLEYEEKAVFFLCRTSNPSAHDFQDLLVCEEKGQVRPLYAEIAQRVQLWNRTGNCGLVVGATYPQELDTIRSMCPYMPILIPGVGAQGGNLEASVLAGVDVSGEKAIISVSRAILYAGEGADYAVSAATEARKLRNRMNEARIRR